MSIILKIIGTLIGVSTVMLTCSLLVACAVRIVQYLANSRGETLGEMLGGLNRGFRAEHSEQAQSGDRAQLTFVHDILTYPALHPTQTLVRLGSASWTTEQLERRRARAASVVEYLAKEDLLAIVRAMLEPTRIDQPDDAVALDPDDTRLLPERWSSQLRPEHRRFRDFRLYVERWYKTLEGVASEQFKTKARRITASISCLLVVFINLDGVELATDIFESPEIQTVLFNQAPSILSRAEAMGVITPDTGPPVDREELVRGTSGVFAQANGILNEPALRLGWQESKIVKAWCACHADPRASCQGIWLGTLRWLAGLIFSCLLLSLGAPFWADMLRRFLNFQNSVKQALSGDREQPRKRKSA